MPIILIAIAAAVFLFAKLGFWLAFGMIVAGVVLGMVLFLPSDVMKLFGPLYIYAVFMVAGVVAASYWLATHIRFV